MSGSPLYAELVVTSWDEAKAVLLRFPKFWAFRGQRDSAWRLSTSIDRVPVTADRAIAESQLINTFKRRAHHFMVRTPLPDQEAEWLALMQHHGAPIRFLDWTRSPYVASYFAFEDATE